MPGAVLRTKIRNVFLVIQQAVIARRPRRHREVLHFAREAVATQSHVEDVGIGMLHGDGEGHGPLRGSLGRAEQKESGNPHSLIAYAIGRRRVICDSLCNQSPPAL